VPNPTEALSNLILADVTPNFRFYQYGLDSQNKNGGLIDSRRRRMELFNKGMFGTEGLLAREKMTAKEMESFRRGIFFEGSFCFSAQRIPGLQILPYVLVGDKQSGQGEAGEIPISDNGDSMIATNVNNFLPPTEMQNAQTAQTVKKTLKAGNLSMDRRCSSCTTAFKDVTDLMSHCKIQGHMPVYEQDVVEEVPATNESFLSFCNVALQRAMGERMPRWGRDYIDPKSQKEATDKQGRSLGVNIYRAFSCEFGLARKAFTGPLSLCLTVDLRAKVIRTKSLLHNLAEMANANTLSQVKYSAQVINKAKRSWKGEIVICKYDKRCYSIVDLIFDKSPTTMPVPDLGMSHADYFTQKKKIKLEYPNAPPMVAVLGRNNSTIYLPPEMVCINELDPFVKMQLPLIASYRPHERNEAIEEMKRYLVPRAQKTKGVGGGLLPAVGIVLKDERLKVKVDCLPMPVIKAAGVLIPSDRGAMWAPNIAKANYRVSPGKAINLNVILVFHKDISRSSLKLYNRVRDLVNGFNATYRFPDKPYAQVAAGDDRLHWGAVEKHFSGKLPPNIFVLDFSKPRQRTGSDPAYAVIKHMLAKSGYLSQFVNFKNYDHDRNFDERKSFTIMQGVARQILSKCGVRVWWVNLPKSVPMPAVFVGVDVFHAPRKYDEKRGKRLAKESVAAVIVQVIRSHEEKHNSKVEIYSLTERRKAGKEMELGDLMNRAVSNALDILKVNPMSCVVWRDGVGDAAIKNVAKQEIPEVRNALARRLSQAPVGGAAVNKKQIPLSYIVVQKRISTKFLSLDGKQGLPCGALITGLQGPQHSTFYINGNAPSYSTPKPARFVITDMDAGFGKSKKVLSDLSWALCHDYPNWTGPIKLPSPVQMAHKLAELAGCLEDGGDSIDDKAYANKIYFL